MDFEAAGIGGPDDIPERAEGVADSEVRRRGSNIEAAAGWPAGDDVVPGLGEEMISGLHGWLAFQPGWRAVRA